MLFSLCCNVCLQVGVNCYLKRLAECPSTEMLEFMLMMRSSLVSLNTRKRFSLSQQLLSCAVADFAV